MSVLTRNAAIAARSYLAPMGSARALRIAIVLASLFVILILVGFAVGLVTRDSMTDLRAFVVFPGLPVAAILVSEMALRDGITHRTLLYPLLGPASRQTLAIVRTLMTAAVLAAGALAVDLFIRLFERPGWGSAPAEILAIAFGALAYVALFGVIHLLMRFSLVACLAVFLFDMAIGMLPFSLRGIAPSYHLRNLADMVKTLSIPIIGNLSEGSLLGSSMFLIILAAISIALSTILFSRKNLGELC